VIKHSCGSETAATSFADPGVREEQFVNEFGNNGLLDTFCQSNYGSSLNTIATKLSQLIGPKCIDGTVAHKPGDPNTPDCTVTELTPNPMDLNNPTSKVIPMCDAGATNTPCWTLDQPTAQQQMQCHGQVVNINDGGNMPASNTKAQVNCSICTPGYPDPDTGCM